MFLTQWRVSLKPLVNIRLNGKIIKAFQDGCLLLSYYPLFYWVSHSFLNNKKNAFRRDRLSLFAYDTITHIGGGQPFSVKGQVVSVLGFAGIGSLSKYLTLPFLHESSHRQYINGMAVFQ